MIDLKVIAQRLIHRQMRVKKGEVVKLNGGLHNKEFIEELAVEIRKVGAFPMINISWDSLDYRMINETDVDMLDAHPHHRIKLEEMTDCIISFPGVKDPKLFSNIDSNKMKTLGYASRDIQEANVKRGARRVGAGWPSQETADVYGLSLEQFEKRFWDAAIADPDVIYDACHQVHDFLQNKDKVHITCQNGSNLRFSIKSRRINMDDGVISDNDIKIGDITSNFPYGEVYCAPIEESVEGEVIYPVVFYKGQRIENLKLYFERGLLIKSEASLNHDLFLDAMELSSGDKNRIGELGIGTNPNVTSPCGYLLLDEKIYGSIHLALGENRNYGGKNISSLHWDMVVLNPTVHFDNQPLIIDGEFVKNS
ncbi:MAG: aminopeptidase [Candidatus Cloacimonetes bacterium]|nr:aminopeptidase [Candidatus Cloacimonadota bacterium]